MTMRLWHIGIAVLLIALVAGGLYYYRHGNSPASPSIDASAGTTQEAQPAARVVPPGFREYRNTTYHFSLLYPDSLSVQEYKEKGTALTVTFRANDASGEGFQVFIVPYGAQSISNARFKQDIPSGVIDQQTPLMLDGKPATMFFSTNAAMGATREVWFINHGFLYEVTTYQELDSWLARIMQTWKFE
jgi:hypothetical protein